MMIENTNSKMLESELLNNLSDCVSEFRDDMSPNEDFVLLEKTIIQVRYLLNLKKIKYKDFRD